jgi:hypothetical protein
MNRTEIFPAIRPLWQILVALFLLMQPFRFQPLPSENKLKSVRRPAQEFAKKILP